MTLDFSKIFNKDKVLVGSTEFSNFNSSSSKIHPNRFFILNPGEYIQITQPDRRNLVCLMVRLLLDFKICQILKILPIDFLKDFSDIRAGLFKVDNLLDLQIKLDSIKGDSNIISITLNTLDINIKPQIALNSYFGAESGNRTCDLLITSELLYQLSYPSTLNILQNFL